MIAILPYLLIFLSVCVLSGCSVYCFILWLELKRPKNAPNAFEEIEALKGRIGRLEFAGGFEKTVVRR